MKPIVRISVADQAHSQLLTWLFQNLTPGMRLPSERELAAMMHVGRSTVREILKGLVLDNVLETKQGRGYFLRKLSTDDLLRSTTFSIFFGNLTLQELTETRSILETMTAKLAARRAAEHEIQEMDRLLKEAEAIITEGGDSFGIGWAFHQAIFKASHNEALFKLCEVIGSLAAAMHLRAGGYEHYPWSYDAKAHRHIWQLICCRDEEAVAQAMLAHLEETYRLLRVSPTRQAETSRESIN